MSGNGDNRFERHWQTQRLVEAFAAMAVGERASTEELARRCDISPDALRKRVQCAKRAALHEHHVIIETLRGFGFERLPQDAADVPANKYLAGARNKARRAGNVIKHGIVDWNALERTKKNELFATQAQSSAIVHVTRGQNRAKLVAAAKVANQELDFGRTLELLGK